MTEPHRIPERQPTLIETAVNASLEAKQASLETHGMMGEVLRELGNFGKRVEHLEKRQERVEGTQDRLVDKVDTLLLRNSMADCPVGVTTGVGHHPSTRPLERAVANENGVRAKMDSISDFDAEVTMNGTRYLRATPEQIEQLVDARIRVKKEQEKLENAAAPVLWFKGNAAKVFLAMLVAIGAGIGALILSAAKTLFGKH